MPASKWLRGLALMVLGMVLAGCQTPDYAKVGLVAPYEGRYREIGYDVIPAARLALREWAARPEAEELRIELVSYDDMGDTGLAGEQARKVLADDDVQVVIGHWLPWTTAAAAPLYAEAGLPLVTLTPDDVVAVVNLSPGGVALESAQAAWAAETGAELAPLTDDIVEAAAVPGETVGGPLFGVDQFAALWGDVTPSPDFVSGSALPRDATIPGWAADDLRAFEAAYEGEPGLYSLMAYLATWAAIEEIAGQHGLTVSTPVDALTYDSDGRASNLPVYVYGWADGELVLLAEYGPVP